MKIPPPNRRRGSAVVIMLALLAIVFVLANANSRHVMNLNRELHRLDERQAEHWQPPADRDRPRSQPHDQTNAGRISREAFSVAAGILPAVEGGIPAARAERWTLFQLPDFPNPMAAVRFSPPGRKARLHGRQGCLPPLRTSGSNPPRERRFQTPAST